MTNMEAFTFAFVFNRISNSVFRYFEMFSESNTTLKHLTSFHDEQPNLFHLMKSTNVFFTFLASFLTSRRLF